MGMRAGSAALRQNIVAAVLLCGLTAAGAGAGLAQTSEDLAPASSAAEPGGPVEGQGAPQGAGLDASLEGGPAAGGASAPGADGAPVIPAPGDPARSAPAAGYAPLELGGVNSFAATDAPAPMEGFGLADPIPVVVELFTSQGCSSCPPADAMLASLADRDDILALSFHVDYWDYLGWADSFARPEFTARQESYARAAGERAVYTPQLIVDGADTAMSLGPAQLMALIDANRFDPALVSVRRDVTEHGQSIQLMPLSDLGGGAQILLIRYAPAREVAVTAGENRGRVVTYSNIVLSVDRLAEWDGGGPLRMTVSADGTADDRFPEDTRHVLLVQRVLGRKALPGPILAAIRLD